MKEFSLSHKKFLHLGLLVLYLILPNGIVAENSCHKGCSQSDSKLLQYKSGFVYEYNVESIMTTGLKSHSISDADDTSLRVSALAKLYTEGNCGYTLQLSAVTISSTKEAIEKKIMQTIQKPIHFTMVNGIVEPEICIDNMETEYAVNIKRAIVSLLQTSPDWVQTEVDIFGQCPTHTTTMKSGTGDVITKVRNLNECSHREKINNGIINGIVNTKSDIKSTMLFQADYSKETKLSNGLIETVHLTEEYHFSGTPKSSDNVYSKVLTTLKLRNANGNTAAAPPTGKRSASIVFQKPNQYNIKNIAALKVALNNIMQTTDDYVKKDSAKSFIELIRLMRSADVETLLELGTVPYPNKILARKVYLDALYRTATTESAKAILKQLNRLEGKERYLAIMSLNLLQDVDKETLQQAVVLITPNAKDEIYLAIGNLVSKYCSNHNCDQSNDVDTISKKFADNLKHCKATTKKDEHRIVHILKGITNTHHIANNVINTLNECSDIGHSNRIRVTAIQSFGSAKCNEILQKRAMDILRDTNEDSELRIEAYLAAIECPTSALVNELAEMVNNETVNQVGGFIVSHLKSIRDSTDAKRENQRYHLGGIQINKKFAKDVRRYSFNRELSYKLPSLGLSASTDYNLIYSQNGFLPRSARFNVTTELFGTNFNLFDGSIRQENLEAILEYFAGPKGLLNKDFDEIMMMIGSGGKTPISGVGNNRARRSIADESNKFAKKYKTYGQSGKNIQDLNLDLSIKMFGSEIMFLSLGDNIPTTLDEIILIFSSAFDTLKKHASSFTKEFTWHTLFMDVTHNYPTGVGIPMELSTQGFVSNHLKFSVDVDIDAILDGNWQSKNYHIQFEPSLDVNVYGKFGFNGHALSMGLQIETNSHSAGGSKIDFLFTNDGNGFNLDIHLPREKIELIDLELSTHFYIAELDKKLQTRAIKDNSISDSNKMPETDKMCYNQLEQLIGVTLCVATTLPLNPSNSDVVSKISHGVQLSQLYRPFRFQAYITSERSMNIRGNYEQKDANAMQEWKLEYSTPNSKLDHKCEFLFKLGTKANPFARLSFVSPTKRLGVEAGIQNDPKELIFYGQHEEDENITKMKIGFNKNANEYTPIIEIRDKNGIANDIRGYNAIGKIIIDRTNTNTKYIIDNIQIRNKDGQVLAFKGWTNIGERIFDSQLHVKPGKDSYFVKSNVQLETGKLNIGFFVNDDATPEQIYGASANLEYNDKHVEFDLTSKISAIEINLENSIEFEKSIDAKSLKSYKFEHEFEIKNKGKQITKFEIEGEFETDRMFNIMSKFMNGAKQQAALHVKLLRNHKVHGDLALESNLRFNKNFIDLITKFDINGNYYVIDNVLTTSWGTHIDVKGELGQRYTLQDIHVDLHGKLQFNTKGKQIQWVLRSMGTPEKTNSEFRANRDNVEIVKINCDLQHPQEKIQVAKLNVLLKNNLLIKSELKFLKNGKGELLSVMELLIPEQKHKIDLIAKFTTQSPKYEIDATLTFDTGKQLIMKSENIMEKKKYSTKNTIEYDTKKISFNSNGVIKGDQHLNGELNGNFILTMPSGRVFDGALKHKLLTNVKTHLAQGNFDLQLNDKLPHDNEKSTVSIKSKYDALNVKSHEISIETGINMRTAKGHQIDIDAKLKHLPISNGNKMLDFSSKIDGNLLKSPLEFSILIDEYDLQHSKFNIKGKYGDYVNGNMNGQYALEQIANDHSQLSYALNVDCDLPKTELKSLQLNSKGKFMKSTINNDYIIDFNIDEKSIGNGKYIKFSSNCREKSQIGTYKLNMESNELEKPIEITGSYEYDVNKNNYKYKFNYLHNDKYIKSVGNLYYINNNTAQIDYSLDTSYSTMYKDFEMSVRVEELNVNNYVINVNGKQLNKDYNVVMRLFSSTYKQGLEYTANIANMKPIVFNALYQQIGERDLKISFEMAEIFNMDFKLNGESSYKSINDFDIIVSWHSNKLNLHNYRLNVHSKDKIIKYQLKNQENIAFTGQATYVLKNEQNKAIIEGQGQLQYAGKQQTLNFKLIRQIYLMNLDNEIGFSYTFNGNLGQKNCVSTFKLTNKESNMKLSICEEKKQCTNFQIQSLTNSDSKMLISNDKQHSLLILIDLRELGYPYEFELQSKTIHNGLQFNYNLDASIISMNNIKYQLITNIQTKGAKIQLMLPKRELLFEMHHKYPETNIFGHYETAISFYFDKTNKPEMVTSLLLKTDLNKISNQNINVNGQIQLLHPLIRPLTIHSNCDVNRDNDYTVATEFIFDIFSKEEQKIITKSLFRHRLDETNAYNYTNSFVIKSNGLNIHNEFNTNIFMNFKQFELNMFSEIFSTGNDIHLSMKLNGRKDHLDYSFNAMNTPLIQFNGDLNLQRYSTNFNTKIYLINEKIIQIDSELQPTYAKLNIKRPDILTAIAEIRLGKELQLNINGFNKQLFDAKVALDSENFLNVNYHTNEEDMKTFLNSIEETFQKDGQLAKEKIKQHIQKVQQQIDHDIKLSKETLPDFTKLSKDYERNLIEIMNQLETDPTLKPIAETYHKIYVKLSQMFHELTNIFKESYENLTKSFNVIYEKYHMILRDTILPIWQEFLTNSTDLFNKFRSTVVNHVTKLLTFVTKEMQKYVPELKNYFRAVNDLMKPLTESFNEFFKLIVQGGEDMLIDFKEYMGNLKTFDIVEKEVKYILEKFKIVDSLTQFVNKLFDQLHVLPQTPESVEFLSNFREYILKKLKNENVNDIQIIENLYKLLKNALSSLLMNVNLNSVFNTFGLTFDSGSIMKGIFTPLPLTTDLFNSVTILSTFRSSFINFILNENWKSIYSIEHFKSWIFFNDFQLQGHITDGHHIITFDGIYYDFIGSCKYILAQDSVDNNFTIIGQINNGKLKSITLTDRDNNFVEINDASVLKVNGNLHEYPIHTNGVHVWRKYYTVWLRSEYGVEIMCLNDLKLCHVNVNGFYTSKMRGLFGNGNAEPYDDYIQVDGTIAKDHTKLIDGYGMGKCNPNENKAHSEHKEHGICDEIFSYESPLALGYLFLNPQPFKEACYHAITDVTDKNKEEETACLMAMSYGSALRLNNKHVILPKNCLNCAGPQAQRELGQEFTTKIPNKLADVVFVVDMNIDKTELTQLVSPAIREIRDTLKTRGFTDIQIGVIAYNESFLYPALLTSNGGKINYQGNIADIELGGPKYFGSTSLSDIVIDTKLMDVIEKIEHIVRSVETQSDEKAFTFALNYPFRAAAAKSIIGVRSNTLEFSNIFKLLRAYMAEAVTKFDSAMLHMIAPVNDLSVEGVPSEKLVGFNSRLVATLDGKDAKKRQKLSFHNDMGTEFVLNNNGWVFATNHFNVLKAAEQRKFLTQVTTTLADSMFKTEIVSDCKCLPIHGLHAQHKCVIKSTNFVPNKKVKGA